MRSISVVLLLTLPLLSAAALSQTAPQTAAIETPAATPSAPSRPDGVSREQYMQRAEERAGQRAAARFDQMDANHDGVLDRAEMRAWRSQHSRRAAPQPAQAAPQ